MMILETILLSGEGRCLQISEQWFIKSLQLRTVQVKEFEALNDE